MRALLFSFLLLVIFILHAQAITINDTEENFDKIEWWKKTNFYHIYIRSFKDSDGDGEGDLRGIIEKLDYLKMIGVETLLMSPFYSSPMKDGGYDIDDYLSVNKRFGSMKDFEDLMKRLKQLDMRIVVDFVPNHTSDLHFWFKCSEKAYIDVENCFKYKDYYIWSNSTRSKNGRPTNWLSLFNDGETAWKWSDIRKEFYLHQFLPEQPDLNLTNPLVREELQNVTRFWLNKGVDGIRIDAVLHFYEETSTWPDEPINPDWIPSKNKYDSLLHIYTRSLYESAKLVKDWRKVANEFKGDKVIITEAYDIIPKIIDYYGPNPYDRFADMPFNFDLLSIIKDKNYNPIEMTNLLVNWLNATQSLNWPNKWGSIDPWTCYVTGNHDNSRLVNRVGEFNADFFKWISYLMPGVPVDYYGDELHLKNSNISSIPVKTLYEGETTRLTFRAPMAWSANQTSGGFSASQSIWMPLNEDYKTNNVESLLLESSGKNYLKNFIKIQKIRKDYMRTILFGDLIFYQNYPNISTNVLAMARTHDRYGNLIILSNFSDKEEQTVYLLPKRSQIRKKFSDPPKRGRVILTNFNTESLAEDSIITIEGVKLATSQSAIIVY